MASFLQQAHDAGRIKLTLKEFDIEISPEHDLTNQSIWEDIWNTLKEGGWMLIVSPPCNTFSRARFHFQDWPGPRPLRNINWPRGFPWLAQHHKAVVEEANMFVDRCIQSCIICHAAGGKFIIEHPEDLGLVKDERPGSIWQWSEVLDLIPSCGACTFAIQQCHFGALTPKPTRFLGTFAVTDTRCHFGLPRFDKQGLYKGPLPKSCGHTHKHKLLGKTANKWNTSPSASYPPALCEFLSLLVLHAGASCGRGTQNQKGNEGSSLVTQTASGKESSGKISGEGSSRVPQAGFSNGSSCKFFGEGSSQSVPMSGVQHPATSSGPQQSTISSGSSSVQQTAAAGSSSSVQQVSTTPGPPTIDLTGDAQDAATPLDLPIDAEEFDVARCGNHGPPIKVEWDGKSHDLIDGFGLCSPTRWHPRSRGITALLK